MVKSILKIICNNVYYFFLGIMEDLEDMRNEAMEKKKSKKRRISDD